MATLKQVARIMGSLAVFFPHYKLNQDTVRAYARILKSIPDDVLDAAAAQAASESEFFPSVAALRRAAIDIMQTSQGVPSGPEAWGIVSRQIQTRGHVEIPAWPHEIIGEAIKAAGGFINLCQSESLAADRARFLEAYAVLLRRYQAKTLAPLPEVETAIKRLAAGLRPRYLQAGENPDQA